MTQTEAVTVSPKYFLQKNVRIPQAPIHVPAPESMDPTCSYASTIDVHAPKPRTFSAVFVNLVFPKYARFTPAVRFV